MGKERSKVLVVEDKKDELRAILNNLARYGVCDTGDVLEPVGTFDDAQAALEKHAAEIRLVTLDLNIPLSESDSSPDVRNGGKLLEIVHSLNRKSPGKIKVIVVSGQEIAKGWNAENLIERFSETLVGVATKDDMPRSFVKQLQKLNADPVRNKILELNLGFVANYDTVIDSNQRIKERLKNARGLAIRILCNEMDYHSKRLNASDPFADDLNGLIHEIENRFAAQTISRRGGASTERRFVNKASIANGTWGEFVWRGSLLQHLYVLSNYRNDYEHIDEKPFRNNQGATDSWQIPEITLRSLESGERLGQIIELIVRDLLDWYLPWHEQVYLPWRTSIGKEPTT